MSRPRREFNPNLRIILQNTDFWKHYFMQFSGGRLQQSYKNWNPGVVKMPTLSWTGSTGYPSVPINDKIGIMTTLGF